MPDTRATLKPYLFQLACAAAGAITSLYLLVEHTRLKIGIQGNSAFCNLGRYADCNAVNASPFSEIGGIPLAALGVLYFLALLLMGLLHPPSSRVFRRSQVWLARLAGIAFLVDVYLLGVQAFALQSFCVFCLLTYLCTLLHLAFNWIALPKGSRSMRSLLQGDPKPPVPPFAWAILSVVILGTAFALYSYTSSTLRNATTMSLEQSRKYFMEMWPNLPRADVRIAGSDPTWGNPAAKVQIVVFSDFECPHCQRAAFALHSALASFSKKVLLVFKNFPLDSTCNPLLQKPMHPNACALARLGHCARRKNRFWDFHDRVFFKLSASDLSGSKETLFEGIKPFFTRKEFDECLVDPSAEKAVREDVQQGLSLQINSTPSLFINGKRVPFAPTVDLVRELVEKELGAL